jgi:hypothetical protein
MAAGLKKNETRNWPTSHRGDLVICSAKHPLDDVAVQVAREHCIFSMPLGYALCVVELYDCVPTDQLPGQMADKELSLGDYTPGRFAWFTRNLRRLRNPVPLTGHQGFWMLPEETWKLISDQL